MKTNSAIDFSKGAGLVPAIVQDARTGMVLMLAYMNEEALEKTQSEGKLTFYSRSKKRLWTKGETSGNYLMLKDIKVDCDGDALLIKAIPLGPTCHTGSVSCFEETAQVSVTFISYLETIIADRKENGSQASYTSTLFKKGLGKIAQKVGEEASEVIVASFDETCGTLKEEAADLLFHLMVLLSEKEVSLESVMQVLYRRHNERPPN